MCSWFSKLFGSFSNKDKTDATPEPTAKKIIPPPAEEKPVPKPTSPAGITLTVRAYTSDNDDDIPTGNSSFVQNRKFSLTNYECLMDKTNTFTAIDFETANQYPDSICQIGIAVVNDSVYSEIKSFLVKPPYDDFRNSLVHGITAETVKDAPTFAELWPTLKPYIEDKVLAAYNARFDIGCLEAVLDRYGIPSPDYMVFDILQSARQIDIPMKDHKLATVANTLLIPQQKAHDAGDDARVAAEIQIYAFGAQKYLFNNIYFKMTDKDKIKRLQREIMSGDSVWREVSSEYPKYKNLPFEECGKIFEACKLAAEKGCKDAHMFRAYGELLEKSGDKNNALLMYQKALALNEKIGLKKKVDKLLKEVQP